MGRLIYHVSMEGGTNPLPPHHCFSAACMGTWTQFPSWDSGSDIPSYFPSQEMYRLLQLEVSSKDGTKMEVQVSDVDGSSGRFWERTMKRMVLEAGSHQLTNPALVLKAIVL